MNPEIKAKWIEALRSGKFVQGRSKLRSEDNKFCCLGVLCEVLELPKLSRGYSFDDPYECNVTLDLRTREVVGLSYEATNDLMDKNDSRGLSFPEIADYIEKNL